MYKKIICMILTALVITTVLPVSSPTITTVAEAATTSASSVKITTQPKSVSVSNGAKATVTVKASGKDLKYQWYYKDTGMKSFKKSSVNKNSYSVTMYTAKDGRQVYCKITDKSGKSVNTNTVTLKVKATITSQPKSVSVANGKNAKVTVKAVGKGLTYTWYYKDAGTSSYKKTDAFKSNTYSVAMNNSRNGRQVYCVIKDAYGNTVKTNTVKLSMKQVVKITSQPSSVSVANGKNAKVTVKATGKGLTYTWYYKDAGTSSFRKTDAFKSNTYSVEMNSSRNGRQVYCVIKDAYGNTVKTNTVKLSMIQGVKITSQPASVSVVQGKTATVSFKASGTGLTYTWYYKDAGTSSFKKTTSFKSNTYSVEMNSSRNGRQVYCVVKDKYGNSVKTDTVKLSVIPGVKITSQPTSVTVAQGKAATVSFKASGTGLTYTWYYKDAGTSSFIKTDSFKSNTYSVEMNSARDGRQVYCVVKDKYGNSVKTNTVKLSMIPQVKITSQPTTVAVAIGKPATVSFKASGTGLTYTWYYKDAGTSSFIKTDSFKSNTYSVEMNSARNGRQVYCVVKDKYGNTVNTNTVSIIMCEPLQIVTQPSNVTVKENDAFAIIVKASGEGLSYKWYYKDADKSQFQLTTAFTSNTYVLSMTNARNGRQVYCKISDKYGNTVTTDVATMTMKAEYTITVDKGVGEDEIVGVYSNGEYSLKTPVISGYTFKGWVDSNGKTFSASGTIRSDVSVKAVWAAAGTTTLKELENRTNAGVEQIVITSDITINKPIYINYDTTIYADKNVTIKRDPNYSGDIFVVGQDKNGTIGVMEHRTPSLTLGGGKGTLTIDGNLSKMNVKVVGAAVFVADSSILNLYDGVKIANNKKSGNERIFKYEYYIEAEKLNRAGGAAIMNVGSTVNMYGGIVDNNHVAIENTVTVDDKGTEVSSPDNTCGGAVYNRGNFNMYGGTISNSEALRGGGIYNDRVVHLQSGTISGNVAYNYGGALSTSSSANADTFIGTEDGNATMLFKNNQSKNYGGALYSMTKSPIIIYGNTKFVGNVADGSGGAIYTGGTLTVRNTTFSGNSSVKYGGAIYHCYTSVELARRFMDVSDCVFENNKSNQGGAVILTAISTAADNGKGTTAAFENCTFTGNQAIMRGSTVGYGGAIYVTKVSDTTINGCTFTKNTSTKDAGAIYLTLKSEATVKDCTFNENTADGSAGAISVQSESVLKMSKSKLINNRALNGGALYAAEGTSLTLNDLSFKGNSAVLNEKGSAGLGGAMYFDKAKVTVDNLEVRENTAGTNGGAVYLNFMNLELDAESEFVGNTATKHGGAFYLTYQKNDDGTKSGSVLNANGTTFSCNKAMAGGAISVRSACEANLTNVKLTDNTVTGYDGNNEGNGEGGGAIYVGYAKVNLNNVVATGNTASDFGGVVNAWSSVVNITGSTLSDNSADRGGAVSASSNSTVSVNRSELKNNESPYVNSEMNSAIGGGAIFMDSGTLTITDSKLEGNKTGSYGGTIHTDSTEVTINKNSVITGSSGATGSALYFRNGSVVTLTDISITDNISRRNGVVYMNSGTLTATNVTAARNSARSGGVFFASGGTLTINKLTATDNVASELGGVLYVSGGKTTATITDSNLNGNLAADGGAVYLTGGTVKIDGIELKNNTASGNGGAVYNQKGTLEIKDIIFGSNNAASANGGAISQEGGTFIATGTNTFTGNSAAKLGGAIYSGYFEATDEAKTKTYSALTMNSGDFTANSAVSGGAVYVAAGSSVEMQDISFTENSTTSHGGAICISDSTLTASNLDFIKNTSGYHGGALHLSAVEVNMDSAWSFKENSAAQHGGAVYINAKDNDDGTKTGSVLNANGVVFSNNTAMAGGAISVRSSCEAELTDCQLLNNSVTGYAGENDGNGDGGGAVYVGIGKVTLNNVTATGNTASDFGGVVNAYNATVIVNGGTFSGNFANNGGVIRARNSSNISVNHSTLKENESLYTNSEMNSAIGGGAIQTLGGTLTITDSKLDGNKTGSYGGTIHADETEVTISENSVITGSAGATGAALYFRNGCNVTLTDISINNNISRRNGVVYINSGTLTATNVAASGNSARSGGVFYTSGGTITANNVTATNNVASETGGVLYVSGSKTSVTVTNSNWSNNTAADGGAAYVLDNGTLNLCGVILEKNNATVKGGAIYATNNGKVNISDSSSLNNNTAPAAGAVYIDKGAIVTVNDSIFDNNAASEGNGGAILIDDSDKEGIAATTLNMTGVVLKNNTAVGMGGALSTAEKKPNLVINAADCTFNANKSTGSGGGAVEILNSNCNSETDPSAVPIVFTNCTFTDNSAKSSGGAIEIRTGSCAKFDGIVATGNSAENNGAVIYATSENSRVYLTGTVSQSNNSAAGGKFIHLYKKNTYTNPPKLYTTHGSDAAWISDVGGNTANIEFGLATLP